MLSKLGQPPKKFHPDQTRVNQFRGEHLNDIQTLLKLDNDKMEHVTEVLSTNYDGKKDYEVRGVPLERCLEIIKQSSI